MIYILIKHIPVHLYGICCPRITVSEHSSLLRYDAVLLFEWLPTYVQNVAHSPHPVTLRHIPEDLVLQEHCCENLRSCTVYEYTAVTR